MVSGGKGSLPGKGSFDYVFLNARASSVNATDFRRIALSMPEAMESSHMEHPDFRVGGKIFATLGYPDRQHGMVVLPPEEQRRFIESDSAAFTPAKGAWGLRGSTCVLLEAVDVPTLRRAMEIAWRKRAPKRLAASTRGE